MTVEAENVLKEESEYKYIPTGMSTVSDYSDVGLFWPRLGLVMVSLEKVFLVELSRKQIKIA